MGSGAKKAEPAFNADMPEVVEALEQAKREPVENILKRREQNFRALRSEVRTAQTGNKYLK